MVRIFDLPSGGLKDGAVAVEVDENGNPVNKNNQYDLNLIPETDFINDENRKYSDVDVNSKNPMKSTT